MNTRPEQQAVIRGFGSSRVGRRLPVSEMALTVDACLAALEDAGVSRDEIDGIATFPGGGFDTPGLAGPGADEVHAALGLRTNWKYGGPEGGQLGGFFSACLAVATGLARHVLVYRTVGEASAQGAAGRAATLSAGADAAVAGFRRWLAPFDAHSPANWIALFAQRHMYEFGTTREHLGTIAVNNRRNAGNNPHAVYRKPLTLDDYFNARMIAEPLCLYDFCQETDGAVAVITTSAERAKDLKQPPVPVVAAAHGGVKDWGRAFAWMGMPDEYFASSGNKPIAKRLYEQAGIGPADIDVALLYDHFTPMVLMQLEDYGFCEKGEGGAFVESGAIRFDGGSIPVNTHGGQLSEAYIVGMTHIMEGVEQMRGTAINQVSDAELALVTGGPASLPVSGLILGRAA